MTNQDSIITKNFNVELIKPYKKNQRIHSKEQISQISKSIKTFGMLQPIVIDSNMEIVVGHARFEASKIVGLKQVPCILTGHLSKEQIKQYRIADNRLNELSYFDEDLLREELDGLLSTPDFDISVIGFTSDELNKILADTPNFSQDEPSPAASTEPDTEEPLPSEYSMFDIIMKTTSKDYIYEVIEAVQASHSIKTVEDALLFIVEAYSLTEATTEATTTTTTTQQPQNNHKDNHKRTMR